MKTAAFAAAIAGGLAVVQYMNSHLLKTPMYNSALSGQAWLQELLNGHPVRFHDNIGMSKHVFQKLVYELQMYSGQQRRVCNVLMLMTAECGTRDSEGVTMRDTVG
jgi:hypothetical protein